MCVYICVCVGDRCRQHGGFVGGEGRGGGFEFLSIISPPSPLTNPLRLRHGTEIRA